MPRGEEVHGEVLIDAEVNAPDPISADIGRAIVRSAIEAQVGLSVPVRRSIGWNGP